MATEVINQPTDYSEDLETDDEILESGASGVSGVSGVELFEDDSSEDFDPTSYTPSFHAQQAQNSLQLLKKVVSEPGWKKIIKHKSGLNVWSKPGIDKSDKIPLLKGEHIIRGFTPQAIFAVIGMRKLWDDWYEEGNLIENLNETTSLTYMVMKALAGSKTRDLSLVEKIECTPDGVIYFVSTSVTTPKIPRVPNKIRAQLKLNGWILDPVTIKPPATKVTYVLQTNVKGMIPSFAVKKYLSRRPLVVLGIDNYLQKNGPPSMIVTTTTPPPSRRPSHFASLESIKLNGQNDSTIYGNGTQITQRKMSVVSKSEGQSNGSIVNVEENGTDEPEPPLPTQPASPSLISEELLIPVRAGSARKVTRQPISPKQSTFQKPPTSPKQSTFQKPPTSPKQSTLQTPPTSPKLSALQTPPTSPKLSALQKPPTSPSPSISQKPPTSPSPSISQKPLTSPSPSISQKPPTSPSPSISISPKPSTSQKPPTSPKQSTLRNDDNFPEMPPPQTKDQSTIIQHRHSDSIVKAFSKLKSYIKTLDDWQFFSENRGVKIYMKEIPGQSMPIMRGEAVISGGWSTEDILATILDLNCRRMWDDRFEDGKIIEQFTVDDMLLKSSIKGTFPISARDFCTVASTKHDTDTGVVWNVGVSVIDPLIPESKKHVRAELHLAGWVLQPEFDDSGHTISVHVTYIVDLDIKLDSIPSSILKAVSTSTPLCVAKIGEYLQKSGCPPYLHNTTGKLVSTEFNTKTLQYDMQIADVNGGRVELRVNRRTYTTGFDISIQPEGVEVELLSNNIEIIRITVPESPSFNTLSINLTKQTSKNSQFTLNGKYDIPIAEKFNDSTSQNSQEQSSLVSKPTSKNTSSTRLTKQTSKPQLTFDIPIIEKSNDSTSQNSQEQSSLVPKPTSKNTSSMRLTKQTSKSRLTLNGKYDIPIAGTSNDPTSHNFQEQSSLVPKPTIKKRRPVTYAAPDRQTAEDQISLKQKTLLSTVAVNDNSADVSMSTTNTMTTIDPSSISPYIIQQQDTLVVNGEQRSTKRSLIVMSETLGFNSHQVGLMFASMLLAYYAGKLSGNDGEGGFIN